MGNLIALLAHCGRGDEVICGDQAHIFFYEQAGMSAVGGIMPRTLRNLPDGTLDLREVESAIRTSDQHFPVTRMIALENTHNRMGGVPISADYTRQVAELAHRNGISLHIDGARIFNAASALNVDVKELTRHAASVTFCLSKGLSAPAGSVLVGSKAFIHKAHRARKMLCGGMRQSGVLAAAGLVALEHMTARLSDDHANAQALAAGIATIPGLKIDPASVRSNLVFFDLDESLPIDAPELTRRLLAHNVRMLSTSARRIRAVTHCWVDQTEIEQTIAALKQAVAERDAAPSAAGRTSY
jgi:threonine aldolase